MTREIKRFLKPSVWKIICFLILWFYTWEYSYTFGIVLPDGSYVPQASITNAMTKYLPKSEWGFPLKCAVRHWAEDPLTYNYINLAIDAIFWYLIVCLIVFIFKKLNLPKILKPSKTKVAIALAVFYVLTILSKKTSVFHAWKNSIIDTTYGFPLNGAIRRGFYDNGSICSGDSCGGSSDGIQCLSCFVIDLLFAYLIVCFIVYAIKYKKVQSDAQAAQVEPKKSWLKQIFMLPMYWETWLSLFIIILIMDLGRLWRLIPYMLENIILSAIG